MQLIHNFDDLFRSDIIEGFLYIKKSQRSGNLTIDLDSQGSLLPRFALFIETSPKFCTAAPNAHLHILPIVRVVGTSLLHDIAVEVRKVPG